MGILSLLKFNIWITYYWLQFIFKLRFLPDKLFLKIQFYRYQGYLINFSKPETLNEKIQFLKLYERKENFKDYADKEMAKSIAIETSDINVLETIKTYRSPSNIDFAQLVYPCVIKTNHGSGDFFLLKKEPTSQEKRNIIFQLKKALYRSLYLEKKEFQYHNIDKKVIIEKMLLDSNGNIPQDYKVHCFNGKAKFIYVTTGRDGNTYRGVYDINWNPLDFQWTHFDKKGNPKYIFSNNLKKPKNLQEVVASAEKLALKINTPYIRIDLFNVDEKRIVFGEFTFHHMSGYAPIRPIKYDYILGNELQI